MKRPLKYLSLVLASLALSALVCQYNGDAWEEKLRVTLYKLINDSIPNYAKVFTDEKGIPIVHYVAYNAIKTGDQYNATIVANYAIDYYKLITEKNDPGAKAKFLNCVNWLAGNISYKPGYALFEFTWRQPYYDSVVVPWTCGLTSGRAIEVFTDAYRLNPSQQYLDQAMALLRGFYQPIQAGSFTYKEPAGWWYEEYADTNMHTPRVLDGHIYALLGVYKFWQLTKNDSAAYVVQQGISSLKDHLPGYDMGNGWSYYDAYHLPSDKKYHLLLTSLMKEIWEITKDPIFYTYYRKWEKPLIKPYIYRIIKERNRSGFILYFLITALFFTVLLSGTYIIAKNINRRK